MVDTTVWAETHWTSVTGTERIHVAATVSVDGYMTTAEIAALYSLTGGNIVSALGYTPAPVASPTFTGIPAAPTATLGTSTTQLATTAFVGNAITSGPIIDVTKSPYNATGNGVTDDSAAFTAAIAASVGTGKIVVAPYSALGYVMKDVVLTGVLLDMGGSKIKPASGAQYAIRMGGYNPRLQNFSVDDYTGNVVRQTTRASGGASGATTIVVGAGHGIVVGQWIAIEQADLWWHFSIVTGVATNTITFRDALPTAASTGGRVWASFGTIYGNDCTWATIENGLFINAWAGIGFDTSTTDVSKNSVRNVKFSSARMFAFAKGRNTSVTHIEGAIVVGGWTLTQTYSGDGTTTTFTLPENVFLRREVTVTVGGVAQTYNQSGGAGTFKLTDFRTLVFPTAPASGTNNISVQIYTYGVTGYYEDGQTTTSASGGNHLTSIDFLGFQDGGLMRNAQLFEHTDVVWDTCSRSCITLDGTSYLSAIWSTFLGFAQTLVRVINSSVGCTVVAAQTNTLPVAALPTSTNAQISGVAGVVGSIDATSSISWRQAGWSGNTTNVSDWTGAGAPANIKFGLPAQYNEDGSAGAPAITFKSDLTTGFSRPSSGRVNFNSAGTNTVSFDAGGLSSVNGTFTGYLSGTGDAGIGRLSGAVNYYTDTPPSQTFNLRFRRNDGITLGGTQRWNLTMGATDAIGWQWFNSSGVLQGTVWSVDNSTGVITQGTTTLTGALTVASWATGSRPASPVAGMMGWNTTALRFDHYTGSAWKAFTNLDGDLMTGPLTINNAGSGNVVRIASTGSGGTFGSPITIGVDSTSTDTNAGVHLLTRGSGPLTAGTGAPDNSASLGAARGTNAVDLSTIRSANTQVASGAAATVAGGQNSTASGAQSTVGGGLNNIASGSGAVVAGGSGNTASGGTATVAGGASNISSANYCTVAGGQTNTASTSTHATVGGGQGNTASGQWGVVAGGQTNSVTTGVNATVGGGLSNVGTGTYSVISGGASNASNGIASWVPGGANASPLGITGRGVWGYGQIATKGDVQAIEDFGYTQTTTATATRITTGNTAASTINTFNPANFQVIAGTLTVVAKQAGTANVAVWIEKVGILRQSGVATAVFMGTASPAVSISNGTITGWALALAADVTNGGLSITVTGAAAQTINWSARMSAASTFTAT